MTLLVSIHDVTPAFEREVQVLDALCALHGLRPALLVVPDWHGVAPLGRFPAFARWLRERAAEGCEIVLHGLRHDETGLQRTVRDALRAWGRTAGEGEFLTLDAAAAGARIREGLACLHAVGLEPIGFVPPAWLATEEAFAAVAEAGLAFAEDARSIRLFPDGRRLRAPAVRWSARTAWRAVGSALVAEARWRLQRGAPVVRLALHPRDLSHPATATSLRRALRRWSAERAPGRYVDLLAA